ncbi:MAG TPA: hypothetical protein VK835_12040 [Bacteroidia bacterium]|nr:hypothetical protein [Bacteroidia bacterium]
MIQQLINPTLNISQRLRIVKTILVLSLITSVCFTLNWWLPAGHYPKMALYDFSFNQIADYILLGVLSISLIGVLLYRSPRFFIFLSTLCLLFAVFTDTAKGQYWLFFYIGVLLLLCGHNWRIDNPRRYSSVFTAIKILVCLIYVLSAIQFLQTSVNGNVWLQFITPLEKICTPEQHKYILGIRYAVPFIEFFVVVGLFINRIKMAAIVIGVCLHLFSFCLLLSETPYANAAVLIWNICMVFLLYFLFAGKTAEQKIYSISFNLYSTLILLLIVFGGLVKQDLFPENKIDLMQSNTGEQFIYLKQGEKNKLPLYIQYFTVDNIDNIYTQLSVTKWCASETKTQPVLNNKQLLNVCDALKVYCGANADIVLSVDEKKNKEIVANNYRE